MSYAESEPARPQRWGLPSPEVYPEFYADIPAKRLFAFVVDAVLIGLITLLIVPFTAFTALFFLPFCCWWSPHLPHPDAGRRVGDAGDAAGRDRDAQPSRRAVRPGHRGGPYLIYSVAYPWCCRR